MSYIGLPEADKSCGVCLAAANNFLEDKNLAALREKTKDMAYLRGGEYQTGSPGGLGDPDEHPRHKVYLDAFYMDKHETTIGDYMRFVKETGGDYPEWAKPEGKFNIDSGKEDYYKRLSSLLKTCETCPIVGITAKNAQAYCASKNKRLPTEAEWEASARAGSESAFSFGDNLSLAGDYAWHEGNSGAKPHPVGEKKPNSFGLYDMHGNVWEWTSDYYEREYYQKSPTRNPKGPEKLAERVIRGGSWAFEADSSRSANRASIDKPNDDIGFRCSVSESALSSGDWNSAN
jgi:formylglycine-generating enzyme required for sulfatase activity